MFCPKCGTSLPDDAAFCGSCGNKIEAKPAVSSKGTATPKAANPAASTSVASAVKPAASANASRAAGGAGMNAKLAGIALGKLKISTMGIVAVACAVCALLTTLAPWFQVASLLSSGSGMVSGAASLFGATDNSLALQESYTVWGMVGLADTFQQYASALGMFGNSQASSASSFITVLSWGCLALWVGSLGAIALGVFQGLTKGDLASLRIGCGLMVITVLAFYGLTALLGSSAGSANPMPVLCLALAAGALVAVNVSKRGPKPV